MKNELNVQVVASSKFNETNKWFRKHFMHLYFSRSFFFREVFVILFIEQLIVRRMSYAKCIIIFIHAGWIPLLYATIGIIRTFLKLCNMAICPVLKHYTLLQLVDNANAVVRSILINAFCNGSLINFWLLAVGHMTIHSMMEF